jgi:hypothetical protein
MSARWRYWVALWLALYLAVCVRYPEPDPAPQVRATAEARRT